jgi:hypothetical protein
MVQNYTKANFAENSAKLVALKRLNLILALKDSVTLPSSIQVRKVTKVLKFTTFKATA